MKTQTRYEQRCFRYVVECRNIFPQVKHLCGSSPVWIRSCVIKLEFWLKHLRQNRQVNGRSPVWINACLFSLEEVVNLELHTWHSNFRSPWISVMCFLSVLELGNTRKHSLHTLSASPEPSSRILQSRSSSTGRSEVRGSSDRCIWRWGSKREVDMCWKTKTVWKKWKNKVRLKERTRHWGETVVFNDTTGQLF